jgi:hypothetical protein
MTLRNKTQWAKLKYNFICWRSGILGESEDTKQVATNQLGETTNWASKYQTLKQKSQSFEEEPY